MICINTKKTILSRDRKTSSSSEQIASDENKKSNGDNLEDKYLDDSLELETIYV